MTKMLVARGSGRFKWFRVLQLFIIAYALLVLVVLIFQRHLIYFPRGLSLEQETAEAREGGFVPWYGSAGQVIGWKLPSAGTATGSVLIVHGNAGCAIDRGYLAGPIHKAATVDVYVLEYPGYGTRAGAPGKTSFLSAGEEAFRLLPGDRPRYVVSESIGAGVAAHLAATFPHQVAGLVMFAPYHDLAAVAQNRMPFLPAYFLLKDRFRPASDLRTYEGPIKVVLAGADEIIPHRFGQRLFDEYRGPKELQIIPDARHNDIASQSSAWWQEVFRFWQSRPSS